MILLKLLALLAVCVCGVLCDGTCPPNHYKFNNYCLPYSSNVCPTGTVFTNGVCQAQTLSLCPSNFKYTNGVCLKQNATRDGNDTRIGQIRPTAEGCPKDTIFFNGGCASREFVECPAGTEVSEFGYCVRKSYCGTGTIGVGGTCIDDQLPIMKCPYGTHLVNGQCVLNQNAVCPTPSIFSGGSCRPQCTGSTIPIGGLCGQCPSNAQFINGGCSMGQNPPFARFMPSQIGQFPSLAPASLLRSPASTLFSQTSAQYPMLPAPASLLQAPTPLFENNLQQLQTPTFSQPISQSFFPPQTFQPFQTPMTMSQFSNPPLSQFGMSPQIPFQTSFSSIPPTSQFDQSFGQTFPLQSAMSSMPLASQFGQSLGQTMPLQASLPSMSPSSQFGQPLGQTMPLQASLPSMSPSSQFGQPLGQTMSLQTSLPSIAQSSQFGQPLGQMMPLQASQYSIPQFGQQPQFNPQYYTGKRFDTPFNRMTPQTSASSVNFSRNINQPGTLQNAAKENVK